MNGTETIISRSSHVGKVGTLYILLLADCLLNAVADSSLGTFEVIVFVLFMQLLIRFLSMILLFLLSTSTLLFQVRSAARQPRRAPAGAHPRPCCASQAGMLDILLREFLSTICVTSVSLLLVLGMRVYRIILLLSRTDPATFFQIDGYFALYIVHNLAALAFYHLNISASFRLSDPKFYDPRAWR